MRHKIYTGSGHHCGVIPYSSVVWWIASWAEDEQLQGKNSLARRGVLVLGELEWLVCFGFDLDLNGGGGAWVDGRKASAHPYLARQMSDFGFWQNP